jgi:hypothetical protein
VFVRVAEGDISRTKEISSAMGLQLLLLLGLEERLLAAVRGLVQLCPQILELLHDQARLAKPVRLLYKHAAGQRGTDEPRSTYSERAVEALGAGRTEPRRRPSERHRRAGAARRRRPRLLLLLLLRPRLAGLRRVHLPPPPFPRTLRARRQETPEAERPVREPCSSRTAGGDALLAPCASALQRVLDC